jgi:hypothetical protein
VANFTHEAPFSGWTSTQCRREGGSRYKLPGPGSPEGDPGTEYVAWFFYIFSLSALAGELEKIVLPGPIPTLGGPAIIRLSFDERMSRFGFRLLVFWLLPLAMYRPLRNWPQISRLHCVLEILSVRKPSITGFRLIVLRIVFIFCLACLRQSQSNVNKVSRGSLREWWVRSVGVPKWPNNPRTQPLSTGDEATLGSIPRKPSKQVYSFPATTRKTQRHLHHKSLVWTCQDPQARRKTHSVAILKFLRHKPARSSVGRYG